MTRLVRPAPSIYIWAEYLGGTANHYILSPTKKVRHYGYGKRGKLVHVHPDDLAAAPNLFRRVNPEDVQISGAPKRPITAFSVPPHMDPNNFPANSPPPAPVSQRTVDSVATLKEAPSEPIQKDPTPEQAPAVMASVGAAIASPEEKPATTKRAARRPGKGKSVRRVKK